MTTKLEITGMSCEHCVRAVRGALEEIENLDVEDVTIGSATVSYDPETVNRSRIADAVREEGYEVISEEAEA